MTLEDETQSMLGTATLANEVIISTPTDSLSIPKDSEQQMSTAVSEIDATNSSTESCKTPVSPHNDVTITVNDDDELKSLLLNSENESSSAEVICVRKELTSETKVKINEQIGARNEDMKTSDQWIRYDNDDMASKDPTDQGEPFVE